MSKKVAIFWPGDYRKKPNEWALPQATEATAQMESALKKLGRQPYLVKGFIRKPDQAISRLGHIDDPMVGVFVHWTYGPHTCDGVVGKDNPLLLASNFSGTWPGLVALLNTGACLESMGRKHSRVWTSAKDWANDSKFMARLDEWCSSGQIKYREDELHYSAPISVDAQMVEKSVVDDIKKRRILALMLGDTSMGMINAALGARVLAKHGFAEHKVDQAWLPWRMKDVKEQRVEDAFQFVLDKGVKFHWREKDAEDFTEGSTKEQLRMFLAVKDICEEFKADCLGWQYQLGLLPILPPSDFCEGLFNSACRPESNGEVFITATEADQGNLVPMELMKRILKKRGLHEAAMFHDVRWGGTHEGKFLWVLLNSGSCGAYAFSHNPDTLKGVHSYRQPAGYFPIPGGTFAGESKPGDITWARAYLKGGETWMDVGTGKSLKIPQQKLQHFWDNTTPQWPIMMATLNCSQETIMAHYLSNHIAVVYGDIFGEMVGVSQMLGFKVRVVQSN